MTDVTTDEGFQKVATGLNAMVLVNRLAQDGDATARVRTSFEVMSGCDFTDGELKSMLAVAIDRIAFPQEW